MKTSLEIHQKIINFSGQELSTYSFKRSLLGIDSAKPKLLCLHGGPGLGSLSIWPGFEQLSNTFDLTFVDLRGSGLSEDPKDGDYSLEAYARDVSLLGNQIKGSGEIGIFGHSFGGSVALRTLAQYPTLFNFGIISNSPYENQWLVDFANGLQSNFPELVAAQTKFLGDLTDTGFKEFISSFGRLYFPELSTEEASGILTQWHCRVKPYLFASMQILPQMDLRSECKSISTPCLILGSSLDRLIPPSFGESLAALIPNGKFALIENAGHFPFLTHTKEFSLSITDWIRNSIKGVQSA